MNSLKGVNEMPVRSLIKIALFKKGMSQLELADRMEVSPQQINNWVSGRVVPKMDKLLKMSDILECSINDFYELIEEETE